MTKITPTLNLSLQFALDDKELAARHRQALPRHKVIRWLKKALQKGQSQQAEFTVRVVAQDEGFALNKAFRHRDYATNVLTFNYETTPVVCADIILCANVIEQEAQQQNKPLQQHYAHLLIHGGLHAQGYDHEEEQQAVVMEGLESQAMLEMNYPDPYSSGS